MLNDRLKKVMEDVGIRELTPVQSVAIPKVLSGRHVLIIAPTGSGKTEAALLPIMSRMLDAGLKYRPVCALYITPLRALNRDMFLRIRRIGKHLGVSVAIRHGDTSSSARRAIALNPPHILITTPETLTYLLVNEGMRKHLTNVRWVVIDEFHELLASKRGAHLLADLERLRRIAGPFQRIALSASIGDPRKAAEALAPGKFVDIAEVPGVREADIGVYAPGDYGGEVKDKVDLIAELVRKFGKTLIFTNTRDEAEWLGRKLTDRGLDVRVHHGSLSKALREEVEELLREGGIQAVVSTSSLELGIDIGHVSAVIQSSSPRQASKFLQRIGRSLHRVGLRARGFIVTDLNGNDMLESVVIARRTRDGDIEEVRPYLMPIDVLSHVLVGMGMESEGFTPKEALEILKASYPFLHLDMDILTGIIEFLTSLRYLRFVNGRFRTSMKGKIYYYRTTMIVDTVQFRVIDVLSNRVIGSLDGDFVSINLTEGSSIVLSGRMWRVVGIDDDDKKVFVEQFPAEEASIPTWVGENIPVDYKVSREACGLRRLIALGYIPQHYRKIASPQLIEYVKNLIGRHAGKGFPIPSDREVVVEIVSGRQTLIVIHACLGSRGNRGLSYAVSTPLIKYLGVEPRIKIDPYAIYLELPYQVTPAIVRKLVEEALTSRDPESLIREGISRSSLMKAVAFKVLSRLGVIPREAPPQVVKVLVNRYVEHPLVREEVFREVFTRYVNPDPVIATVEGIREGRMRLRFIEVSSPSPIAEEGIRISAGFDRVKGGNLPRNVVSELVKRRLMGRKVRLYCMVCGNSWEAVVGELPERIVCSKCGYSLVAPYFGSEDLTPLVRKGLKAGRRYKFVLSGEERKRFEELMEAADLVLTYGRRAVVALAARGVGPRNARRLLTAREDSDFYVRLHDAERTFLRTRRYWKNR
ncbi:MAG: DEAD/DEAH box helicase [Thermoprotei archaeon]|nr:MAG: DEAD/DEAH box helicase [Thermoprotei archaeon]